MFNIKDHLIVKDNFFDKKTYNEILKEISTSNFKNRSTTINEKRDSRYAGHQIYFNVPLDFNHFAVENVRKKLFLEYELDLSSEEHAYFLSGKHNKPTPHCDYPMHVNCIVYLKGETIINSGTGFYDVKNNQYDLNRHIGFKENTAIIFDSNIFHASLQFNDGAKPRYMMANFFKYRNKK